MNQATLELVAQEQFQNDDALWNFLTANAAAPVMIDISHLSEVTAAQLQLLISARKQRRTDGVPMVLSGMTGPFREGLTALGVPADFFEEESL